MTKGRLYRLVLVLDYFINVLTGGWYDEWLSTRAWRLRNKSTKWRRVHASIDYVFRVVFRQKNHCFWSYVSDNMHRSIPPEKRS